MNVTVNGELKPLEHPILSEALAHWGYRMDMPMAIAVNLTVIPNSSYETLTLQPNDSIEILMPMQGG